MRVAIIENGVVKNVCEADPVWASNNGGVPTDIAGIGWICEGTDFSPPPAPPKTAQQVKAEINAFYTTAINVIVADYPETERNSWPKQESEARAYAASPFVAATPLLSAIATARGIAVADLAARVILKADEFAVYAGAQIGRRRVRMEAIDAAASFNNQAALEAVVW